MVNLINKKQLAGIYLIIIGTIVLLKILFPMIQFHFIILLLIFVISIQLIVSSLIKVKRNKLIIPGVTLLLLSVFLLIYFRFFQDKISLDILWPILGLFPSIALIIYYIISKSKSPGTIIPGIFIGIISIIIFLNNLNLYHLNFTRFLIILIALMIILIGLYMLFQNKIDKIKRNIENN